MRSSCSNTKAQRLERLS